MIGRPGAALVAGAVLATWVGCSALAQAGARLPIPGSGLRLGMRLTQVDSLAAFRIPARQGSSGHRSGLTRFFGLDATTTLDFESGRLTHAHFEVHDISTHSRDYVYDQLARAGLRPACDRRDDQHHECAWDGVCPLHVGWQPGTLTADARAPQGWTAVDSAAAPVAEPRKPAAPIAALAPSAPVITTTGTSPAPVAGAGGAAVAGGSGAGAASGPAAAASGTMLPDTLFIGWPNEVASRHRARTQVPPADPVYPEEARSAGVQGVVRLLATVDARGLVSHTQIVHSIPELDRAAIEAAASCHFIPLGPPGSPQGFVVLVQVRFVR